MILAGITISLVFSENGIIEKAKIAKNTIEEAIKEEQEGLNNILEEYNNFAKMILTHYFLVMVVPLTLKIFDFYHH